ncbi:hypothetical protein DH2020_005748 [Rehmannia glutinosa]|uniref:CSC1-like protein n=1 Tax=Rehmannia glutinosa TaxID=99300 RepID=A0ABR0XGY6_REHGL
MEYVFTFWACFMLYKEYDRVASMRLNFLASQGRRAEQFTVLIRNVPHVSGRSVSDSVETFFQKNHPDHYLCHQALYNANKFAKLVRKRNRLQNWLDYNQLKFERHPDKRPTRKLTMERQQILKDPKSVMSAAFVSFNSRWGAAVCAQTQQSKNPTLWLTNWAPEPRDVYWKNLAIPFVSLSIRKLLISLCVFALVFFYMIPIAFVQSLANLEGLEKVAPFLRPLIEWKFVKSFLQGFLPGLALKIFLYILPAILMIMSKVEGHVALSVLERRTAAKYYYFMLVNVFLGSIVAGTAFQQLHAFLHQSATHDFPPKEHVHCENREGLEKAMNPGGVDFPETLPSLQLYFLLGIVYMVVTPILLPFILVFFALAYFVYRHQVINVYDQQYESAAAFWPHVHGRIIASLLISQLLLMGLLSTKEAANSTPLLVVLPVLTLSFHKYCKNRFEPAFRKYPLEEAMSKDTQDHASESDIDLKAYLADAYLHPIFHSFEEVDLVEVRVDKNQAHVASPSPSELSSPSPQYTYHHEDELPHTVQHYEVEQPHTVYHYEVESPSNVYRSTAHHRLRHRPWLDHRCLLPRDPPKARI